MTDVEPCCSRAAAVARQWRDEQARTKAHRASHQQFMPTHLATHQPAVAKQLRSAANSGQQYWRPPSPPPTVHVPRQRAKGQTPVAPNDSAIYEERAKPLLRRAPSHTQTDTPTVVLDASATQIKGPTRRMPDIGPAVAAPLSPLRSQPKSSFLATATPPQPVRPAFPSGPVALLTSQREYPLMPSFATSGVGAGTARSSADRSRRPNGTTSSAEPGGTQPPPGPTQMYPAYSRSGPNRTLPSESEPIESITYARSPHRASSSPSVVVVAPSPSPTHATFTKRVTKQAREIATPSSPRVRMTPPRRNTPPSVVRPPKFTPPSVTTAPPANESAAAAQRILARSLMASDARAYRSAPSTMRSRRTTPPAHRDIPEGGRRIAASFGSHPLSHSEPVADATPREQVRSEQELQEREPEGREEEETDVCAQRVWEARQRGFTNGIEALLPDLRNAAQREATAQQRAQEAEERGNHERQRADELEARLKVREWRERELSDALERERQLVEDERIELDLVRGAADRAYERLNRIMARQAGEAITTPTESPLFTRGAEERTDDEDEIGGDDNESAVRAWLAGE